MLDLNFIIPEIFLTLSILVFVLIGVFVKNSFEIIYRLTILTIFSLILIILTGENQSLKNQTIMQIACELKILLRVNDVTI